MNVALIFVASALLSNGVIAAMLRSGRVGAIDTPNERSLHARAVPRSGGLGVMAGVLLGVFATADLGFVLPLSLMAVTAISWLDDRRNLPARIRFAVHLVAAAALAGLFPAWGWVAAVALVLGVVWLTNLYNFMDGSDGLAGGMTLFGFGAYALAAMAADSPSLALLSAAAAGGAAGFLIFNFHPARIFMGDVGSIPLGFLAGAIGLIGVAQGLWPLPFMLLVFSPFIVDATVTLTKRALRGERVWQAHREHYYQRLVQSGWGHRRVALAGYGLMAATALCALGALHVSHMQWIGILAGWAGIYACLAWLIDRRWRRFLQVTR